MSWWLSILNLAQVFHLVGASITSPDVGAYFFNNTAIAYSFHRYATHHLNVRLPSHVSQGDTYQWGSLTLTPESRTQYLWPEWESGNETTRYSFCVTLFLPVFFRNADIHGVRLATHW